MTTARPQLKQAPKRTPKQRGVVTVEFALLAPLLFLLLCIVMDMGIALWVNLTMQYAVREGARYSVTGQSNLDPSATNQQRYLAIVQEIKNRLDGFVQPGVTQLYDHDQRRDANLQHAGELRIQHVRQSWRHRGAADQLHLAVADPTGQPVLSRRPI